MLSSGQTSAQFVGSYPFNGSQAKEVGASSSTLKFDPNDFKDLQEKNKSYSVNGWGGSYYPNGCPHCGYCPTCGRSNGHYKPYWEWQPWNQPYYMSSHYAGAQAESVCNHAH